MGVDPSQYDPDELRALAGIAEPEIEAREAAEKPSPEESIRSQQFRDLLALRASRASSDLDRPYLRSVPTSELGRRVLTDWLEFLVLVGGSHRAREALTYYRELDWLTPDVEHRLSGLVGEFPEPTHERPFEMSDHRLSLLYVATLSALE